MLVIREETLQDVGQVRMINIAAFEQPDEAFMIRILDPQAMVGASGVARYHVEFDAAVWSQSACTNRDRRSSMFHRAHRELRFSAPRRAKHRRQNDPATCVLSFEELDSDYVVLIAVVAGFL